MELYIGGAFQGKLDLVKIKYSEAFVFGNPQELLNCSQNKENHMIWNEFHLYVRECLSKDMTTDEIKEEVWNVISDISKLSIICDEIGNGIVPVDPFERTYREELGRILIEIAQRADHVYRVSLGIASCIK